MREIDLGKLLGKSPQPNIVKFIGCVTTQGKKVAVILLGKSQAAQALVVVSYFFNKNVYANV